MLYQEFQPPPYFSHHIECYWEMELMPNELDNPLEALSPDCTFDLLFTNQQLFIKSFADGIWKKIMPGATFMGQKTSSINFIVHAPVKVFGIRFKPFAFANLIKTPLFHLNDQISFLDKLFELNLNDKKTIQQLITSNEVSEKIELAEALALNLLKKPLTVDQTLRAQLNYIMDRKGLVKISDLFSEFGTSKVTLRKHFINKIGLSPKIISRIWRINYFLQLQKSKPEYNLTELCLEAGFYDQAHFIKEFKSFFGSRPYHFFKHDSQLIRISQESITKRFSNQYDPRD